MTPNYNTPPLPEEEQCLTDEEETAKLEALEALEDLGGVLAEYEGLINDFDLGTLSRKFTDKFAEDVISKIESLLEYMPRERGE